MPSYLQLNRFGVYRFRRAYPPELRALVGALGGTSKTEFILSLRTKDPKHAKQLARVFAFRVERFFELLHRRLVQLQKNQSRVTEQHGYVKTGFGGSIDLDGKKKSHRIKFDLPAEEVIAMTEAGLSLDDIQTLVKATGEALHRAAMAVEPIEAEKDTPLLSQAIQGFLDDLKRKNPDGWNPPSKYSTIYRRLTEILGDIPMHQVGRKQARLVFDTLAKLPNNVRPYRGMTVPEIVEAVQPANLPISEGSVKL